MRNKAIIKLKDMISVKPLSKLSVRYRELKSSKYAVMIVYHPLHITHDQLRIRIFQYMKMSNMETNILLSKRNQMKKRTLAYKAQKKKEI